MALLGYTEQELNRMQEIVAYSAQDAHDNQDQESYKWLTELIGLLQGLISEGRV